MTILKVNYYLLLFLGVVVELYRWIRSLEFNAFFVFVG